MLRRKEARSFKDQHMRKIRRFTAILCIASLLCSGCGKNKAEWTALQTASNIAASQEQLPEMKKAVYGSSSFDAYVEDIYGISADDITDGAVLAAGGTNACEIAVLRFINADPKQIEDLLNNYVAARTAAFTGYFPEQEKILRDAAVSVSSDGLAALIICPDRAKAEDALDYCRSHPVKDGLPVFDDMTVEEGGNEGADDKWEYDHDSILNAWESGDYSGLDDKGKAVIKAAEKILKDAYAEGQSVPEYELAIHDILVDVMEYDTATLENYGGVPEPNNDNPYGALIGGRGICLGYTRTFQLLMDMAGIECISIYGHSDNGEEYGEHAWNQVRLDGEWYIVDSTWDDPLSSMPVPAKYHHWYFNVTSEYISDNHFWDRDAIPEAEGTTYTWDVLRKD